MEEEADKEGEREEIKVRRESYIGVYLFFAFFLLLRSRGVLFMYIKSHTSVKVEDIMQNTNALLRRW